MHIRENWDDLRFALAVARTGSVSKAAAQLGVNHATVLRRVAAMEERYGTEIFEKNLRGYRAGPGMAQIIQAIASVEDAVYSVERALEGIQAPLRGSVRVTSTDTFCQDVLPPLVAELHTEAPELHIELISANIHLDLARLDADLTVRPANTLADDLEGFTPAKLGLAAYAPREGNGGAWIGVSGPLSRSLAGNWMSENVTPENIVTVVDSFQTMKQLITLGVGQGVMPCILGDGNPALTRIGGARPLVQVPIWVAGHRDLTHVQRINRLRDRICEFLGSISDKLAGE